MRCVSDRVTLGCNYGASRVKRLDDMRDHLTAFLFCILVEPTAAGGYTTKMKYIVIRHAQTDGNRLKRALEGKTGMPLNAQGIETAKALRVQLDKLGIDLVNTRVAVSELQRTQQTATHAGFSSDNLVVNAILNEVNTADPFVTHDMISRHELPPESLERARQILANPPTEQVWVTHGLVLAGLIAELGLSGFIPEQGSITVIEL